jgi:hypothetical protein
MGKYVYRVHPAINFGRVGNSEEYYLGPETPAGLAIDGRSDITGGLPILIDEETTITSKDLRDKNGALKRQAARFRIFQYPKAETPETYPTGEGKEITIGSTVDGKEITDIIWTVHMANKKANWYWLENPDLEPYEQVIDGYADGKVPMLRNLAQGADPSNAARIRKLVIDPGPRTIRGCNNKVKLDKDSGASFWESGTETKELPNYPKSFPDDSFSNLYAPQGKIDTLGELKTDKDGRLHVVAAYGRACALYQEDGTVSPLEQPVDNDGWFDDTGDGPVSAVLVFKDDSTEVVQGAWVVTTDPSYAPQTLNVVSLWDDIYDSWVRKLSLDKNIFDTRFKKDYQPVFDDHLLPTFRSASLQQWNTNLPVMAIKAHEAVGRIEATDDPADTILSGLAYIRNPNNLAEDSVGAPLMPLSLGDQGRPFMSVTLTQYFFLTQWNNSNFQEGKIELGPGEYLDRAVLLNCLGGRFSPGIDMTFIVRQPELYIQDWQISGFGPFRINPKKLNYNKAQSSQPFLTLGWTPLRVEAAEGVEPGDTSKFMSVPWHTDYNSCASHPTDPPTAPKSQVNTPTLFWSWPAQRPVAVFVAQDVKRDKDGKEELGPQRFSIRGKLTETDNPAFAGKFQRYIDFVKNWYRVGFVIQGTAIDAADGGPFGADHYLEVQSQLDPPEPPPWPMNQNGEFSREQTL